MALARALVNRPQLLLLDEPLSALDANLRRQMQVELKSLQREVGIAFVFVTHDQEEAMVMSDRIALLRRESWNRWRLRARSTAAGDCLRRAIHRTHQPAARRMCAAESRIAFAVWQCNLPDGSGTVFLAAGARSGGRANRRRPVKAVRFRGKVQHQAFHGATELVRVECADGLISSLRTEARRSGTRELDCEFFRSDAVPVRESPEEANYVFARISSRRHGSAAGVGYDLSARALSVDVLLQLLVGFSHADHRAFLDSRELSRNCSRRTFIGKRFCGRCGSPHG